MALKICEGCGEEFEPTSKYETRQRFCNSDCRRAQYPAHMSAASHPDYFDRDLSEWTMRTNGEGYVVATLATGISDLEHRLVLAQKLGRPLRKGESGHHLNGDRSDNRAENLELWKGAIRPGVRAGDVAATCPHCGEAI